MKFLYQARTKDGRIEKGTIEASSKDAAAALLQKYNIFAVSIKEAKSLFFFSRDFFTKKVSKKDLAIFSRQLAVMLNSRVPVVQSLLSLSAQITRSDFREKIIRISELVEEGNNLSEAFAFYPELFDAFYISLLKSGEASGKISESLFYLSDHLEREYDTISKIKGALLYPILVLVVFVAVVAIVFTFVMPKLLAVLREMGSNVPLSTKVLMSFYNFFAGYGWILAIGFVALAGFMVYYFRTEEGRKVYDKQILRMPFIGSFLQKTFTSRFAENLSTLVSAGLSITRSLRITRDTITNTTYKDIVTDTEKGVVEGEKISLILAKYPEQISAFVVQMVKVGEQTGKLDSTLMEVVNFYNKEIERMVNAFMTLLEPILIILLGIAVAILAVSVLSPMYGVLNQI